MGPKEKVGPCLETRCDSGSDIEVAYIASLLSQLKNISDRSGDRLLTYLIEVAEMYALELQNDKSQNIKQEKATLKEGYFKDTF